MGVSTLDSLTSFTGNNSIVTPYVVPWRFLNNADVKVDAIDSADAVTTLVEGTDYTVTGAGVESGGSFITTIPYDNTWMLKAWRDTDQTQELDYTENDNFPAESHELGLDKLTMLLQEMQRKIDRSLRVTESSDLPGEAEMINATDRVYGIDGTGMFKFLTAAETLAFLELGGSTIDKPTAVWANDAARAAKVPDFESQLGVQTDTEAIYVSDGVTAGDWSATINSVSDNSVGLAQLAHAYGNSKLIGTTAAGVPESIDKSDYVALADTNAVSNSMMANNAIGKDEMKNDAIGLQELEHTYGNDKVITTDSSGTPEVQDKVLFDNNKVQIRQERASGTDGGASTADTWHQRNLNVKNNDNLSHYSIRKLTFTSGGTYEVVVGDTLTGATSADTCTVYDIELTSGSWAAGTAAGDIWINDESGAFTSGEDFDVDANTNVLTMTGLPANAHAIRLGAGTYILDATAPAHKADHHALRLYDATAVADISVGCNSFCNDGDAVSTRATLHKTFTLSVISEIHLLHFIQDAQASDGLGKGYATKGELEVYAEIIIQKIST